MTIPRSASGRGQPGTHTTAEEIEIAIESLRELLAR
jgi:hypothetical protein